MSIEVILKGRDCPEDAAFLLCNKASAKSPYCRDCIHGKPHTSNYVCQREQFKCRARPWVGGVKCTEFEKEEDI
jgi:hypothetical protein